MKKKKKNQKRSNDFKDYAISFNVENGIFLRLSYNLKILHLQLKFKLIDLLPELKGSEFVATLVLEFKKMQSNNTTLYNTFHSKSKKKQLLIKLALMMCFNQSIVLICQTHESLRLDWITDYWTRFRLDY